jgi:hypothetical protein
MPRRTVLSYHLPEVIRLYVEEHASLTEIASQFKVSSRRLSFKLRESGVSIRPSSWRLPNGQPGRSACPCGKPILQCGLCKYHYRLSNNKKRAKYDGQDRIGDMCEQLDSVVVSHPQERIGIVADIRKSRYGINVSYFWQGSEARLPERARLLGYVPERLSMKASRMLLRQLDKSRRVGQRSHVHHLTEETFQEGGHEFKYRCIVCGQRLKTRRRAPGHGSRKEK